MKLVTVFGKWPQMKPEYVPGKCNIGARGRAIRVSTGAVLIALSVVLRLTLLNQVFWAIRLVLALPVYVGLLAGLEGSMSFCVLHAARGTFDLSEPMGFASRQSKTLGQVGSEEWKRVDRSKAQRMHFESAVGAILISFLLALA